jgi:putative ABC transport system permease protein
MIKHYLKIAFRISKKAGTISLINILGLSIGLAICIIIFIYVRFEMSFDRYHEDNNRIFRVEEESNQHNNGAGVHISLESPLKRWMNLKLLEG